jgi:hypothetical protein
MVGHLCFGGQCCLPKILVSHHHINLHINPENHKLYLHCHENLKSEPSCNLDTYPLLLILKRLKNMLFPHWHMTSFWTSKTHATSHLALQQWSLPTSGPNGKMHIIQADDKKSRNVLLVQTRKRKWQKRTFILLQYLFTDARTTSSVSATCSDRKKKVAKKRLHFIATLIHRCQDYTPSSVLPKYHIWRIARCNTGKIPGVKAVPVMYMRI